MNTLAAVIALAATSSAVKLQNEFAEPVHGW
jgi:hypothetical protein